MDQNDPSRLTRRSLAPLAGAAAVALARPALAQAPRTLSVITSAAYKRSFDQYIVPKMLEMYNVKATASAFLSAEALARALAQRANPQVSVISMDQGPWLQGKAANLWATLGPAVANLQQVPQEYRDPDDKGVVLELSLLGMMYDKQVLAAHGIPEPTSIFDLWKPEFRDRLILNQFSSSYAFALLAYITELEGGDVTKSFDAGFAKLKQLRPNVRSFVGQAAQLSQAIQQKEAWASWGGIFTALQSTAAGAPITWVAPKEGAVASAHVVAIAEGSPNREDAERMVNLMLTPEFEKIMAELDYQVPINPKTELSPAFAKTFPVTAATVAGAKQIPWPQYNAQRVRLNERWQREIEQ